MNTLDALDALRSLDGLAAARRRYLCAIAAEARTDADRARIILEARHEDRRARETADAALKTEYAERAALANYSVEHAEKEPRKPAGARRWDGDGITYPEPRPITISWTTPTKTAPAQVPPKRRRLNEPVRHHGSSPGRNAKPVEPKVEPKVKPEPKPKTEPEHGTLTRYQKPWYCRCPLCREVKRQSNARHNAKRSPKHGTTHMYNGSTNRAPCRCEDCKAAKVVSNAKAREQMKLKKRSGNSSQ